MQAAHSDGICIWDAFGTYSCGNPGASVSGRAMFPAAVLEGFSDASGPSFPEQEQKRMEMPQQEQKQKRMEMPQPKPQPKGSEGFCGCSASLH